MDKRESSNSGDADINSSSFLASSAHPTCSTESNTAQTYDEKCSLLESSSSSMQVIEADAGEDGEGLSRKYEEYCKYITTFHTLNGDQIARADSLLEGDNQLRIKASQNLKELCDILDKNIEDYIAKVNQFLIENINSDNSDDDSNDSESDDSDSSDSGLDISDSDSIDSYEDSDS